MEDFEEDLIWNKITNSAKKKFDYKSFEAGFKEIDENLAENILFKVIVSFASEDTKEFISAKLFSEMLLIGFMWEKDQINAFLRNKDKELCLEIYVTQLANSMLEDGNNATSVLNNVNQLIN